MGAHHSLSLSLHFDGLLFFFRILFLFLCFRYPARTYLYFAWGRCDKINITYEVHSVLVPVQFNHHQTHSLQIPISHSLIMDGTDIYKLVPRPLSCLFPPTLTFFFLSFFLSLSHLRFSWQVCLRGREKKQKVRFKTSAPLTFSLSCFQPTYQASRTTLDTPLYATLTHHATLLHTNTTLSLALVSSRLYTKTQPTTGNTRALLLSLHPPPSLHRPQDPNSWVVSS